MKKRTTTRRISEAITNNVLRVTKAERYDKNTHQITTVDNDTFIEALQFLDESGPLADCISWSYEKNYKSDGEYIIEAGRMSDCNVIITVYCRGGNEIEGMLLAEETE